MKEISDIYLGRMNNGAHFTYVSNLLTSSLKKHLFYN